MFLALLLLTAAGIISMYQVRKEQKYTSSFPAMGTVATVTLYTDKADFLNALKAVQESFAFVTALADCRDPRSELARLNKEAAQAPFVCSPAMWEILTESRLAYKLSEGAFDISVKPLMDHWGFYRKKLKKIPPVSETAEIKKRTGLDKVIFDDRHHTVRFPGAGFAFDLGGIAKGYAIELAAGKLIERGVTRGVIDLGGNLRLLPDPPPGKKFYSIGIRRPDRKKGGVMPEVLQLKGNTAVSSSGDYERFVILEGKKFGHIIDPATGNPAPGDRAVTAATGSGTRSDWLSTAVYLRGRKMADKLKKQLPQTQFFIIEKEKY